MKHIHITMIETNEWAREAWACGREETSNKLLTENHSKEHSEFKRRRRKKKHN